MSPITIVLISDVATFVLSMVIPLFVAGMRWGEIKRDINTLKQELAEIKGMFVLRLRDDAIRKD